MKDGNSYLTIFASVYGLCDTQNLINIISGLISAEGASSLGAQVGGSLIFDLPAQLKKFQQAPSTFQQGQALGNMIKSVTGWALTN